MSTEMQQKTIFTKIIERDLPAYILAEDEGHIAFLDIAPEVKGHTLVVPKAPVDYFFAMEDHALMRLICFAKNIAHGIQKAISCLRIGMKVHGLDVPHAHIHLIPILYPEDFAKKTTLKLSPQEMQDIANAIIGALRSEAK